MYWWVGNPKIGASGTQIKLNKFFLRFFHIFAISQMIFFQTWKYHSKITKLILSKKWLNLIFEIWKPYSSLVYIQTNMFEIWFYCSCLKFLKKGVIRVNGAKLYFSQYLRHFSLFHQPATRKKTLHNLRSPHSFLKNYVMLLSSKLNYVVAVIL